MAGMSEKLTEIKNRVNQQLNDNSKPWDPVFKTIEEYTGVERVKVFLGLILVLAVWLVYGFAQQFLCNLIAIAYPVYASLRALESSSKEDDSKWLTYWVVYALFTSVEFFANIIVGWFPLYWLMKSMFMLWLMAPIKQNGSIFLYKDIVRPFFLKQEPKVRQVVNKIESTVGDVVAATKQD